MVVSGIQILHNLRRSGSALAEKHFPEHQGQAEKIRLLPRVSIVDLFRIPAPVARLPEAGQHQLALGRHLEILQVHRPVGEAEAVDLFHRLQGHVEEGHGVAVL